jgi:uncharacterized protein YbjT (DUF2867 family)
MIPQTVHVIGANGRSGLAIIRSLLAAGVPVRPVVRDLGRWLDVAPTHAALWPARVADLGDTDASRAALADATRIVSTAHARTTSDLLAAAPASARLVLLGSTRRYTRWPDAHGEGVLRGEAALLASGRRGVMLHPTMIYGAEGENNVRRLAGLLRRLPLVPLPGGGRSLVQPIHQDDVARCVVAALEVDWPGPTTLVIAGPAPMAYADLVREVAAAAGLKRPRIVPVPAGLLMLAAPLAGKFLPSVSADEIRRLTEDKAFDIAPMRATLGVAPIPLTEGLSRMFDR